MAILDSLNSTVPIEVVNGGTQNTAFTAYAPVVGGTTSTGALQQATTGFGSSGFVLTSTGSSSLPTWQAGSSGSTGTFTPTLTFGGNSVGISYSLQLGEYYTIGNIVFFKISLALSSKGSSTGVANITGLPFPQLGLSGFEGGYPINAWSGFPITFSNGALYGMATSTTTTIGIYQSGTGTAVHLTNANFGNTTAIVFGGFYFTS